MGIQSVRLWIPEIGARSKKPLDAVVWKANCNFARSYKTDD